MKKDPYATAEESASVMAKGLTTKRIAAINHVLLMMDARDAYEMCGTPEYQIKELYEVAYDLAEQRAELLGALKDSLVIHAGLSADESADLASIRSIITKCEARP